MRRTAEPGRAACVQAALPIHAAVVLPCPLPERGLRPYNTNVAVHQPNR